MSQTVSLLLGAALIVGVGGFVVWQNRDIPAQSASYENGPGTSSEGITAAAVAVHKDASSCWTSINGSVYDLTSWIPKHPGGPQAILQLCGTDGSAKFNAQHGSGELQAQILTGFKIGTLSL